MPVTTGYFNNVVQSGSGINWLNSVNAEGSPDGLYSSCAITPSFSSKNLIFSNWSGAVIPSNAQVSKIYFSLFGHCSNPNSLEQTSLIGNGVSGIQYLFGKSLFDFVADTWTVNYDNTQLFSVMPTIAQINSSIFGFFVILSAPIAFVTDTTYIDSARMQVVWSLPEELPCYSRKRRRFKNKKGKIISQQTRLKI